MVAILFLGTCLPCNSPSAPSNRLVCAPTLHPCCRKCTGHPNIIQLYEVFITQHYLAIVLEYASGGDLLDYVNAKGGLSEDEARWD